MNHHGRDHVTEGAIALDEDGNITALRVETHGQLPNFETGTTERRVHTIRWE